MLHGLQENIQLSFVCVLQTDSKVVLKYLKVSTDFFVYLRSGCVSSSASEWWWWWPVADRKCWALLLFPFLFQPKLLVPVIFKLSDVAADVSAAVTVVVVVADANERDGSSSVGVFS